MSDKTKRWIKAALVRSVRTIAQTMAATIGTSVVVSEINWKIVVSSGIVAGVLSILTSLAGLPEVELEGKALTE
mgnify:CR=1 FL=1